jgi:hypothetical protein
MQSRLTLPPKNPGAPPPRLNPDLGAIGACTCGHYPWDDWERYALWRGLDAELAALARLLIREAFNHAWPGWLKSVCGWSDDGAALLDFALRSPEAARRQWEVLMRTDGLRGDYRPRGTEWVYGFLRADAQWLAGRLYKRALIAALLNPQRSTHNGAHS